ncbi:MAG: serine/threonine-protein phosphatase [Acidobacteria bacterium]|nr:serine/threonine-protein phosphatase [Acidobacteriota bacterium]MBV9625313.1 serine/threonine-protein phosphatase [Acidobacteriota bacterium]
MKARPGVDLASLTDVGCERENNEDSYGYWESDDDRVFERLGRLVTVADGMGGCEGGQFASRIAVDTVEEVYSAASGDPQRALLDAFEEAHRRVQTKARESHALKGMGTTLTAFALVGSRLYFAHVGDSRIYRLRTGKLEMLTRDHSLVSRLVQNGVIRAEEADSHPQRHVLIAAIGVAEQVQPDSPPEPLPVEKSDVLLVCTDGLWTQAGEEEIARELASNTALDACRSLVRLAKERGGPDNITLEILRVS